MDDNKQEDWEREYDAKRKSEERLNTCDFCGYETTCRPYKKQNPPTSTDMNWLCHICANNIGGNALDYPDHYPDFDVLVTINNVGNVILDAIKALKESND